MPQKRFPRLPEPPNQAPMWQSEENDPYQGIVSHRGYDANAMQEFPAPFETDSGLEGGPDDLPGLQDPGFIGDTPHYEEASMQQRDPRIDAIEQMSRQGQVQRPGMKTEQDYRQQFQGENPDFTPTRPRMPGLPQYDGAPTQGERAQHDEAAQMTDEQMLEAMHKDMMRPGSGTANPMDDDTNALAPFTGNYADDVQILERELKMPGADQEELNRMFNELHGDDQMDDRSMDPPTNEQDMRSGRY